jgi:hypothetical protein
MMNKQGLAEQGFAASGAMSPQVDPQLVAKVKEALMNGISPDELIAQGVPQEVIEQAIMELQAEMGGGEQQPPVAPEMGGMAQQPQGLAAQGY